MSLSTWIGFFRSNRNSRRRSRKQSAPPLRRWRFHDGAYGVECLEARAMLSAVVIDRSSDPSADTIDVSTSGSNTLISVNGTNVYTGASSSISSLSITGSAYNDTISFDFTNGDPVPDASTNVNGGGGTNTLAATAGTTTTLMELDASQLSVQSIGGADDTYISNITESTLVATRSGTALQLNVNGFSGNATINIGTDTNADLYALPGKTGNTFWAHSAWSNLQGPGYSYTTNGLGDSVNAFGNGRGDQAGIDDQGATGSSRTDLSPGGNGVAGGDIQAFSTNYEVGAIGFGHIDAQSYNSGDVAYTLGYSGYMGPSYSTADAEASDTGGIYTAAFSVVGYTLVEMNPQNVGGQQASVTMDDNGSSGTLYSHPLSTTFEGPGYENIANAIPNVTATSDNLHDVADMDDNGASGGSNYITFPGYSYWEGNTPSGAYVTKEQNFTTVNSVAYDNASDSAFLNDNVGGATVAGSNDPQIQYAGVVIAVYGFGGSGNPHVSAYNNAPNGQYDTAQSSLKPYVVFYGYWTFV